MKGKIMASNTDRVTYDVQIGEGYSNFAYPYRTEALYGPDVKALTRNVRPGGAVQVIHTHGDSHWTDAIYVGCSLVDPELGMLKYTVMIDDAEHTVSQDRIRPKQ